jgi:hypothetical protein
MITRAESCTSTTWLFGNCIEAVDERNCKVTCLHEAHNGGFVNLYRVSLPEVIGTELGHPAIIYEEFT